MRVHLTTLGCRLNEAEAASWTRELDAKGHQIAGDVGDADVIVVNTCAVTAEAGRKSRKHTAAVHRKNPSARLVMTGCYSQLAPETAQALAGVDLVLPNADKDKLVERLESHFDSPGMPNAAAEPGSTPVFREIRTRAFVKVQDGCRNRCTFCIVTSLRGDERSRPVLDVVGEVQLLVSRGYQEVVLTGVHLGGYGQDIQTNLVQLTEAILKDTDVKRLRLSSLEPWDLPPSFAGLWQSPRLMPHLHLPLQSGADTVLRRMARRCPTEQYRRLCREIRGRIDNVCLTTDLIVGFPGETDQEWRETLAFVEEIGFSHVHIFSYSRRQGTPAARMGGHVPKDIKKARSREVHDLAGRMKAAHHRRYSGDTRKVLWESECSPLREGGHEYAGYTDNYLRVRTQIAEGAGSLSNRITETRLACGADPREPLIGTVVRV